MLAKLSDGTITGTDIIASVVAIAQSTEEHMGGTSGALYSFVPHRHLLVIQSDRLSRPYSIFFSALAQSLSTEGQRQATNDASTVTLTQPLWSRSLTSALDKLYTYTRARPPSRTLVDPLDAFISTLPSGPEGSGSFAAALEAAVRAAENTRHVAARAGRSAYIEVDRLQRSQVPDPGAWGVKIILENLVSC